MLLLYQLLRRGQRPDLVIFYDGVNDTFTGYQNGIGGLTQSEFFRVEEFSLLGSSVGRKRLYRTALHSALMSTGLAELVKLLAGKDNPNMLPHEVKPSTILSYLAPPQDFEGIDAVERDVVDMYLFNVQVERMLGERFKFRSVFYWQPTVFSKNRLAPFERRLRPGDPTRAEFFKGTYKRLAAAAAANGIIDISGILDNRRQDDFIDPYHLNESANQIVADRMAADIAPMLDQIAQQKRATTNPKRARPRSGAARGSLSGACVDDRQRQMRGAARAMHHGLQRGTCFGVGKQVVSGVGIAVEAGKVARRDLQADTMARRKDVARRTHLDRVLVHRA